MTLMRHTSRFKRAYRELAKLEQRESWSRQQIDAFQLERLNAVWGHAMEHVPYYRQLNGDHELPKCFSSLDEFRQCVPLLRKSKVRANPRDFLSDRPAQGGWTRTGGSTGEPMSTYWAKAAHLEVLRTQYRYQAMWDVDIFDPAVYIWGHSALLAPGWKGRISRIRMPIEDRLRNRLRLSAYHLGREDLQGYLQQLESFRPVSVYGYSRAIYLLAMEAETHGFDCGSIKLLTLTGEPAFPFIVDKVQDGFNAAATIEYGSIECGVIAAEWPDRTLRVREDVTMVETVPREDGRYEIVVSVLTNPSYPLLRYAIADVTDEPIARPAFGFSVLKNVAGRNNDFVVTKSGRYLHSARFDALMKYAGKAIRRFRVRQHADGPLAIALELTKGHRLDVASLRQRIESLVEGYEVEIKVVDQLPQTAAGKHRPVMSQLATAMMKQDVASR